ncbi:hypothetical protein [Polaribacter aestuariivivens]|uniref:hypothetical protein n=1 Tax=Polaribacter aestuariivivens TaxID=2304626 RepID=UPI003F494E28
MPPTKKLRPEQVDLSLYAKISQLFSGRYEDLTGKPETKTIPYKSYVARITQSGANAPTVVAVLQNDFESLPTWSRQSTGIYRATNVAEFTTGKTIPIVHKSEGTTNVFKVKKIPSASGYIQLSTHNYTTDALEDSILGDGFIEIRVYN